MAKRAPTNQKPFTALDKGLAASVMNPTPPVVETSQHPIDPSANRQKPKWGDSALNPSERPLEPSTMVSAPSITARRPILSPKTSPGEVHVEKVSREKRVLLSRSEEREIERCVDRIAEGFGGTPIKLSHIVRACLAIVRHAESQVIRRAQDIGQLSRPANGDTMALVEFEHEIAKVLSTAFRDAPPLR